VDFGGPGTSDNPCSDIYHGPYPFSEPCVEQTVEYLLANRPHMNAYNDIHASAQM